MSFKSNQYQQVSMDDSFLRQTARTQKIIQKSWAADFADIVFPAINGNHVAVLYSDNSASRPNTPINIIVGALILKEEMMDLAEVYQQYMNLHSNIKRMDSTKVASRCKCMSRLEIIYQTTANAVRLRCQRTRRTVLNIRRSYPQRNIRNWPVSTMPSRA